MGLLAETKIRRKLSQDPNNTKWSRDTTTFGQKMLRAQGWQPGQFLGSQDASHAELHTAANASYIRVALKDDMKGLGFDRAKDNEVTGLDVFSDLLGRLNGRSEEAVESDRMARMATKTNIYVERRWGPMRFVKGGLLVGDKLKELKEEEDDIKEEEDISDKPAAETIGDIPETVEDSRKEKKSKKRKAVSIEEDADTSTKNTDSKKRQRKEDRKNKKNRSEPPSDEAEEDDAAIKRKDKKSKKDKSRSKTEAGSDGESADNDDRTKKRKSRSKDKKERSKESGDDGAADTRKSKRDKKEKKKRKKEEAADCSDSEPTTSTGVSTPAGTGTGTSTPMGNRNFVRARFIAQKKQAVMDAKALNQIFMLKT